MPGAGRAAGLGLRDGLRERRSRPLERAEYGETATDAGVGWSEALGAFPALEAAPWVARALRVRALSSSLSAAGGHLASSSSSSTSMPRAAAHVPACWTMSAHGIAAPRQPRDPWAPVRSQPSQLAAPQPGAPEIGLGEVAAMKAHGLQL